MAEVKITNWNSDEVAQRVANALEEKIRHAGEELAEEAKRLVPVRTGALRDSIRVHVERDGDHVTAKIGSALKYAARVELGTERMHARPYLRRALEHIRAKLPEILSRD